MYATLCGLRVGCWRDALAGCLSSLVSYIGENISDLGEKFSGPEILVHVSSWLKIFGNTGINLEGSVNTRREALVTHS